MKKIGVIRDEGRKSVYHIVVLKVSSERVKVVDLSEGKVIDESELSYASIELTFRKVGNDVRGLSVIHPESPARVRELVGVEDEDREVHCLLVPARCRRVGKELKCSVEDKMFKNFMEALRSRPGRPLGRHRRALS